MSAALCAAVPWSRRDVVLWTVLTLAGCALLLVAWNGASNELKFEDDLVWLEISLIGVVLASLANALWFLSLRRNVRRLRSALLSGIPLGHQDAVDTLSAPNDSTPFVATPQMKHFHRDHCQLAVGKAVEGAGRSEHERAGRVPCGVCRP